MPRYEPAIIGSQELGADIDNFNEEIMRLNEELDYIMDMWGYMIRTNCPQEELDEQEKQCNSKSRRRKMLMNKRLKAQIELYRRDTEEFLYLRSNVRS
jgi:hypothetical protein